MSDHWELYSSVPGWEEASAALDTALANAVRVGHHDRAAGMEKAAVRRKAEASVEEIMLVYENYGATDSEPRRYLDRKLSKEF